MKMVAHHPAGSEAASPNAKQLAPRMTSAELSGDRLLES
jgi:hypothetical protein